MSETLQFFAALYSGYASGLLEIRSFRGSRKGPREWFDLSADGYEQAEDFLSHHSLKWECYMGVLPRTGKGGDASFLAEASALWVDVDAGDSTVMEVSDRLVSGLVKHQLPKPGLLVRSGGGLHAYWLLSEVVAIKTMEEQDRLRRVMKRLILAIGGDTKTAHACEACSDPTRILRPPGTYNLKLDQPRPVKMIRHCPEEKHSLIYWEARLPALPLPPPPKPYTKRAMEEGELYPATIHKIEHGAPHGKRHPTMRQVAYAARRRGHDENVIRHFVEMTATNSGVSTGTVHEQRHIDGIIDWVMRNVSPES